MNVKLIALSQTVLILLIRTVPGEACHQSHQMKSIYLTSQMKMETSRAMILSLRLMPTLIQQAAHNWNLMITQLL